MVEDILRLALESLGSGSYERIRGLLMRRLGAEPSSVLLNDPSEFIRALKDSLGGEADSCLTAIATVLRARGVDIDKDKLEGILMKGDREEVRRIFLGGLPGRDIYGRILMDQLDIIGRRRVRAAILSSILIGTAIFLFTYLMTIILQYYIPPDLRATSLFIGAVISVVVAIENYLIMMPKLPSGARIKVKVVDQEALKGSILSGYLKAGETKLDLLKFSRELGVTPNEVMKEIDRLRREGKLSIEF